jgi:hypothetical protein
VHDQCSRTVSACLVRALHDPRIIWITWWAIATTDARTELITGVRRRTDPVRVRFVAIFLLLTSRRWGVRRCASRRASRCSTLRGRGRGRFRRTTIGPAR